MKSSLQIDAVSSAVLVNRYLAHCTFKKYDHGRVVQDKTYYKFQWQNLKTDILGVLRNPLVYAPRIALSILAFWFVVKGRPVDAYLFAFAGEVAVDDVGGGNQVGEPASITWTHTAGGTERAVVVTATGLSSGLSATYDGNAVTSEFDLSPMIAGYVIAPATGAKTVAVSGGNIKIGGSVSFNGADQSDPIGAKTTENASASPNEMDLTTTRDGSIRLDIMGVGRSDTTVPSGSLDSGDEQVNVLVTQNQFRYKTFMYTDSVATAGITTKTWTTDASARQYASLEILPSVPATTKPSSASRQSVRALQNIANL